MVLFLWRDECLDTGNIMSGMVHTLILDMDRVEMERHK